MKATLWKFFLDNDKGVIFKRYGGKLDDDMITLADSLDNEDMLEFADEMRQMVCKYRKLIKDREKRELISLVRRYTSNNIYRQKNNIYSILKIIKKGGNKNEL